MPLRPCWRTPGSSTMDDAGTEHRDGWVLVEDGLVCGGRRRSAAGCRRARRPGRRDRHAGPVNTHHHLYQTLTRARAQEADLFTWLKTLYPVWARLDAEAEYAAARTGLAELALSGCTTVFDHHYVFPRGETGLIEAEVQAAGELRLRIVASRGSMDLGESDRAACRPTRSSSRSTTCWPTPSGSSGSCTSRAAARACRSRSRRARPSRSRVASWRSPRHSPGARGLLLHTHLAETVEEEAYCSELYGCRPVEYLERLGWLDGDVWCAHCVHLTASDIDPSPTAAPVSRIARPRTCGSGPGFAACASSSTRASGSGLGATGRRRTSAATSRSRSSRRCSWRAAAAGRKR